MSYQREKYQEYLNANGIYNTSPYCSGLNMIEKTVNVDIDQEYDTDKCKGLLQTLLELRGSATDDAKKYGQMKNLMSKLNKYCLFRDDPDRRDGVNPMAKRGERVEVPQSCHDPEVKEDSYFFNTNGMTAPMEEYIKGCYSFEQFEAQYLDQFLSNEDRVGQYLDKLLGKYTKNQATVSELAGLDRSYVGNIVRGKKNDPSRDVLLAICLAIGTTADEAQHLLRYAGHAPLYVRRKRDVIIWFGFMKKRSAVQVNIDLEKYGLPTLLPKRKNATDGSL